MALDANVDPDLCIGSGDCTRTAPGAFVLDEQRGVSLAILEGLTVTDEPRIVSAARGCPTQAIQVTRDGVVIHASNQGR
jgi:ferredoxin